jgi:hypothetical protein
MIMQTSHSILYFEEEGRKNLPQVLRVVKRAFNKRPDLRGCCVVVFTAIGEGPALAYNLLQQYDPRIVAVTMPPDFSVQRGEEKLFPRIPEKLRAFFSGVGVSVVTGRLPFDSIDGCDAHNEQMTLIRNAISLFGGGFAFCVQAVLQACDHGVVEQGERVIAVAGDSAAVITASTTKNFLSRESGLAINEVLCKARNLTIARGHPKVAIEQTRNLFEQNSKQLFKPSPPEQRELLTTGGETETVSKELKK